MLLTDTDNLGSALRRQRNVIFALMLRNMRTKFFGNGLGYVLAIVWPLSHILLLVLIYTLTGRMQPYGDSIALFVATGVVPFQTFAYVTRFMMINLIKSRPLLALPEVKVLDMLFSTALLEIVSAFSVVIVLFIVAWFAGIDAFPRDIVQASCAFGACILMGVGFGFVNGVICLAYTPWFTGYVLVQVLLWLSSGIFFVPDALPPQIRDWVGYQPTLQLVEWVRSAYYEGYGNIVLDREYPLIFGVVLVFLGLTLERLGRGKLLSSRS